MRVCVHVCVHACVYVCVCVCVCVCVIMYVLCQPFINLQNQVLCMFNSFILDYLMPCIIPTDYF